MLADSEYDLIVVGAGMCGSAAARHALALDPTLKVLLLGPRERHPDLFDPLTPARFCCHADEGRITRRVDPDPVWAALAARSIARYAELEADTGISFHTPVGFLALGSASGAYISRVRSTVTRMGLADQVDHLEGADEISKRFPFLNLDALWRCRAVSGATSNPFDPHSVCGVLEPSARQGGASGAGYISARRLVEAQQVAFSRYGGLLLREAAEAISPLPPFVSAQEVRPNCAPALSQGWQCIRTTSGRLLLARRVLVATNAATNLRSLLPHRMALRLMATTTARFVIPESTAASLRAMPAIVARFDGEPADQHARAFGGGVGGGGGARDGDAKLSCAADAAPAALDSCYILPPVQYPEGYFAIKIGHGSNLEVELRGEAAMAAWYEGNDVGSRGDGVPDARTNARARVALTDALAALVPLAAKHRSHIVFDRCVTADTAHGRPYIAAMSTPPLSASPMAGCGTTLACCVGCNGYAAKSSDEIGRLAARLVLRVDEESGSWADGFDPEDFRAVYENTQRL